MINTYVTHNGKFHLDEITGYSIVSSIFANIELIRTRDEEIIKRALHNDNIVVADVGKILGIDSNNFDHHFTSSYLEIYNNKNEEPIQKILIALKNNIGGTLIADPYLYNAFRDNNLGANGLKKSIGIYIKNELNNIKIESIEEFLIYNYNQLLERLSEFLSSKYLIDKEYLNKYISDNKIEIKLSFLDEIQYRKFSSAGLIWNQYGERYILGILSKNNIKEYNFDDIAFIFNKIDRTIIKEIDLADNGLTRQSNKNNTLSNIIATGSDNDLYSPRQDTLFINLSNIVSLYIDNNIINTYNSIMDEKLFLNEFIEDNNVQIFSKYPNGLNSICNKYKIGYIDYIIYPGENNTYYIKTMKKGLEYSDHNPLPIEWLSNKPQGLMFCHNGLFIAQFTTLNYLLNAINYNK